MDEHFRFHCIHRGIFHFQWKMVWLLLNVVSDDLPLENAKCSKTFHSCTACSLWLYCHMRVAFVGFHQNRIFKIQNNFGRRMAYSEQDFSFMWLKSRSMNEACDCFIGVRLHSFETILYDIYIHTNLLFT